MAILRVKDKDGNLIDIPAIKGDKGDTGVSITSISQTTTSTENGGENIITITLSDEQTFTVSVLNGTKGDKGDAGETNASDINAGVLAITHGGTGYATIEDTTYTIARYRASALVSTETNPTVNGVINWTYA